MTLNSTSQLAVTTSSLKGASFKVSVGAATAEALDRVIAVAEASSKLVSFLFINKIPFVNVIKHS